MSSFRSWRWVRALVDQETGEVEADIYEDEVTGDVAAQSMKTGEVHFFKEVGEDN